MRINREKAGLIIVDVQKAFDEIEMNGIKRNNPQAIYNIVSLISMFRLLGGKIIHIRHASLDPTSPFQEDRAGFVVKEEAKEWPGETVIKKHVNSSFIGTNLEGVLKKEDISSLIIIGATTNHCVETTARMAGNMGYATWLISDATWTYDRVGVDGKIIRAEDIHYMTLSNCSGEFCQIMTTEQLTQEMLRSHE